MKPASLRERIAQIDDRVAQRLPHAPVILREFLRDFPNISPKQQPVFEWYRKLSCYREGYQLAARYPMSATARHWRLRFLNLMGASQYAVAEARRLEKKTSCDHILLGQIFLSNGCALDAQRHFARHFETSDLEKEIQHFPMNVVSYADSLALAEDYRSALALVDAVRERTPKVINRGIAWQARGEYLARQECFAQAAAAFEHARELIPAGENGLDHIYLKSWSLYVDGQLKNKTVAAECLRELATQLRQLNWREETWLECYEFIAKLGALSEVEQLRLKLYPGIETELKNRWAFLGERLQCLEAPEAELHIELSHCEYKYQGRIYSHLTKEIRLIALLKIFGDWGVGVLKLASFLWPDQPFDIAYIDARVAQLRQRLKRLWKIETRMHRGQISMVADGAARVSVNFSEAETRPHFLLGKKEFSAREIQSVYKNSLGHRHALLKNWLEAGWIKKSGRARATRYEVV